MKFLLIRAGDWRKNEKFLVASPSAYPPLGLLYIGTELEQAGHDVEIIDYCMEGISKEKLENALMSSDDVGIGVHTSELKFSKNISKTIREIDSDIPMIIGGPHCTFFQ